MINFKFIVICIIIFFGYSSSTSQAMELKSFNSNSYQHILKENTNKAFLLVLWSIDCPPCYDELMMLGQYLKKNPELKIILISTDSFIHKKDIQKMLIESHLQNQEQWVFSDKPSNQLRYSIDPGWYGELPRSYFFTQKHERSSTSGKLGIELIKKFVATNY